MMKRPFLFISCQLLIISFFVQPVFAQYEIKGQLANCDSLWGNTIFLSIIKPDAPFGLFSGNHTINSATLDSLGNFVMKGNNLPKENYLVRLILGGKGGKRVFSEAPKNYLTLLMNNQSKTQINATDFSANPLAYTLQGDFLNQNKRIKALDLMMKEVLENYQNPYSLKGEGQKLTQNKVYQAIRSFSKPIEYPLVTLYAIEDYTSVESGFLNNRSYYEEVLQKFKQSTEKSSPYVKAFEKHLKVIKFKQGIEQPKTSVYKSLFFALLLVVIILIGYIVYLKKQLLKARLPTPNNDQTATDHLIEQLTKREREILYFLAQEYQNKEIASELNLGLSTVKTHVANIYQKLDIQNRQQTKQFKALLIKN
ncbi:hypothetical protein BKI52_01180 [marine bacterium AO1-C]|nr:hypothetical protein BKI52_01180 [marine bacterium AO1-C]